MLVAACGDNGDTPIDAPLADAPEIDAMIDAPTVVGPRGPKSFELPGVAYGAFWDNTASTLYITDDTNRRLVKWTDANGIQPFGTFATAGTFVLGAIVQLPDKSFLVPNLGMGTAGNILTLSADGQTAGALPGPVAVDRRRVGITLDATGSLYESFFVPVAMMSGMQAGSVASVDMTTGDETVIANTVPGGLKKVTGIVVTSTTIYVCEQPTATTGKIWMIANPSGTATAGPTVPGCDLFFVMPNGDLTTGGVTGGIYRITPTGTVTTIRSGFEQVRGIAYDPTMKRMFVVEHRATMATKPLLHVFPLDG